MRKTMMLLVLVFISFSTLNGQYVAENYYWYYFSDKDNSTFRIDQPEAFLSQRSIDRRAWQNIPIDESDLPVCKAYVDSLRHMDLEIVHCSKWLNGVLIHSNKVSCIDTLSKISFIDTIPWSADHALKYFPSRPDKERFPIADPNPNFSYGYSQEQINQLNLHLLHEKGYTGSGVLLTVLDAGFLNMNELSGFQIHYSEDRIKTRNFVNPGQDIYSENNHTHGTHVSSIAFSYLNDSVIGAAPDVHVLLGMTENPASETKVEEFAWIAGAEWADSLGTDIINTSLGYTTFDDSTTNYSWSDLDGKTAYISRANSMTASKGMISVTSAGNEGNDPWYRIGMPADARDILSVGAVGADGVLADFSSRGPSADYRIKPEISARGSQTVFQYVEGNIVAGSGTSFSSPMIAGATACLWQAFPLLSAKELMEYIIESADRYADPDIRYGFGVPNYISSFHKITSVPAQNSKNQLRIYPNPIGQNIHIDIPPELSGAYLIQIIDMNGKVILQSRIYAPCHFTLEQNIRPGMYLLQLHNSTNYFQQRILKQ